MHQKIVKQQPVLVDRKGPILVQDNAKPLVSRQTVKKLTELYYEVFLRPPYSPDLSSTDFHLFRNLSFLKVKIFENDPQVAFSDIISSQNPEFSEISGIEKLMTRCRKFIEYESKDFE
ncbi:histone-lysine N-methyltransferase SETMAR-like [Halyomorpha halys]|uniref:histone-lysine N-methyltransferase SETMAR-like n=1 Tax=Halyomorpha halys TaxID=286706 RepID=UPI0034D29C28